MMPSLNWIHGRLVPRVLLTLLAAFALGPGADCAAADNPPGPLGKADRRIRAASHEPHRRPRQINGQGPFHLIFDLGAPITLLSSATGEKSGVIAAAAPRTFFLSIRGEAVVDQLQLGDLTARDVPVIVLDHPVLKELGNALGRPLDGIIGYTFFARYQTTIDYQARTITFEPVDFQVGNLMRDLPEQARRPQGRPPDRSGSCWSLGAEPGCAGRGPGGARRTDPRGAGRVARRCRGAQAGRHPDHTRRSLDHLDRRHSRRRRQGRRPRRHRRHPPRRSRTDADRPIPNQESDPGGWDDGQG